jgi:hypothetical protein
MTEKKPAPKSSAERQAAYRRRLKTDDENRRQRLNIVMGLRANLNLEVLAAHYGTTKREALERALVAAEGQALAHLSRDDKRAYRRRLLKMDKPVTA